MTTIIRSARYCVDRDHVEVEKEKRNIVIVVLAHLVQYLITSSAQGHPTSVTERPRTYHTVCEYYLVFETHCDRLERGFTY
jgi:hypothetical protein